MKLSGATVGIFSDCCLAPIHLKFFDGKQTTYAWYVCSSCLSPCSRISSYPEFPPAVKEKLSP